MGASTISLIKLLTTRWWIDEQSFSKVSSMVDGIMNKVIKKLESGDFEVVSTSYSISVKYVYSE